MKKNISLWIGGAMMMLAIIYGAITSCHGLLLSDTGYFISKYATQDLIDVYRPFSRWCYKLIVGLFGDYLIVQRMFVWIIYTIGIFVPVVTLTNIRKHPLVLCVTTTIALLFFPMADIGELAFNGNALSVLLLTCTFVALYKYIQRPTWYIWGLLVFSLCICVLSRIPNITVMFFVLMLLPFISDSHRSRLYVCGAVAVSLLMCFGIYLLMYGGVDGIISAISTTYASQDGVGEADHSVLGLLSLYLSSLKDIVSQLKYLTILALLPFWGYSCKRKIYTFALGGIGVIFFIYLLVARMHILHLSEWSLFVYTTAAAIIPCLVTCILGLIRVDWAMFGWSILPICFSVCAAAGSAGGLYLMAMPLLAFMPFVVYQLMESLRNISKEEVIYVIIGLLGISLCCALYVREGMQIIGLLGVLMLFGTLSFAHKISFSRLSNLPFVPENAIIAIRSVFCTICLIFGIIFVYNTMFERCHEGTGLLACSRTIDNPKMKGIRVSNDMADYLTKVLDTYSMTNQPVVFYGKSMWFFEYLTGCPAIEKVEFSCSDKHPGNFSAFKEVVDEARSVCFLTAEYTGKEDVSMRYPIINDYLIEQSYNCKKYTNFAVYYPIELSEE